MEGQVRGDQGGGAFVALAEDLEEQFRAGLGKRHEAEFVDDQQLVAGDLLLEAAQLLLIARLPQFVGQGGCGGEVTRPVLLSQKRMELSACVVRFGLCLQADLRLL